MSDVKQIIEDNFSLLSSMSTEEYILYRKWLELNNQKWKPKELQLIQDIKNNIWQPESYNDYKQLNVKVIYADTPEKLLIWRILRLFTHSAIWSSNPGRNLRFYVVHEDTGDDPFGFGFNQPVQKYLGVISLGSDFISIGGRDNVIGWTSDDKMKRGMLKHTAMGSSISPTQPLGYNYLGGKLISLLVLSDVIEQAWNNKYNEKLVGVTTTSLFGGFSQYNNLNYWKKCKSSEGQIPLEPSEDCYEVVKNYCKEHMSEEYIKITTTGASHPKNRIMQLVFRQLGVKVPKNNMPRGVYWAALYNNSNDFLSNKTNELGEKKFDNSVDALVSLWKEKYAKKRIESILKDDRYNDGLLFYDDILGMTWDECKEKYLKDVGR